MKETVDHKGNVFASKTEMCDFYGISRKAYDQRISRGWSQEEALTNQVRKVTIPKRINRTPQEEKEKRHNYYKEYYAKNREKELERNSKYKKMNKEKVKAKDKLYREKNRDKIKAYRDTPKAKKYQQEYQRVYQPLYRAKKRAEAEQKEIVPKNL